jgi:hypothetical protein
VLELFEQVWWLLMLSGLFDDDVFEMSEFFKCWECRTQRAAAVVKLLLLLLASCL